MAKLTNPQKELIFDYCAGITSEEQTAEAKKLISSNPEAAEIHAKITAAFAPLDTLEEDLCPEELVEGTIWRLSNAARSSQLKLQQLLKDEQARTVSAKTWYWKDLVKRVANAAVFMIVGGLLISTYNVGINVARQKATDNSCKWQLGQMGIGINNFKADHNGQMPAVAMATGAPWWKIGDRSDENNSNTRHMWRLVKEGYVDPGEFVCPGRKQGLRVEKVYLNIPYIENLNDFPDRRYVTYSLRIMCKKNQQEKMAGQHALIADLNPLFEILPHNYNSPLNLELTKDLLEANSINHGRRGQNILFCDGSARFVRKRVIGIVEDDIFTLQDTQVYKGDERPSCETDAFLAP
jgi:prepilin-type processing-associated H-X9-DG protein